MSMSLLGHARKTHEGKLIVEVENLPRLGRKVFDDREDFVGNVTEYIGSTKHPHVLVNTKHSPKKYDGKKLFI